jgi:hypothetical protein
LDFIDRLAALLAERYGPRETAARALDILIETQGARNGGVFRPEIRLRLFVAKWLDEDARDAAQQLWNTQRASLASGMWIRQQAQLRYSVFVPLVDKQDLVGLLYLDSFENAWIDDELVFCGRILLQAMRADERGATETNAYQAMFDRLSAEEFMREQLLFRLRRDNWNFARTAERYGVTRQTINNWTKKRGIRRPPRSGHEKPRESES